MHDGKDSSLIPIFLLYRLLVAADSVPFRPPSQMNHAAAGKRHAQELLETLYRELAILGIVAFILWSINVSPAVDIEVRPRRARTFLRTPYSPGAHTQSTCRQYCVLVSRFIALGVFRVVSALEPFFCFYALDVLQVVRNVPPNSSQGCTHLVLVVVRFSTCPAFCFVWCLNCPTSPVHRV